MLSVHTNYPSMVAQNFINKNNTLMGNAMERLSTGIRINHSSDDPAGLQIADRMNNNVTGMHTAKRNISDAIGMLQTADGAMDELHQIAARQKELATQAANGVYTDEDKTAMTKEYNNLLKESRRILSSTTFADKNLFGSLGLKVANETQVADAAKAIVADPKNAVTKALTDAKQEMVTAKSKASGTAEEIKNRDNAIANAKKSISSAEAQLFRESSKKADADLSKDFNDKNKNPGTDFQIGAGSTEQLKVKLNDNINISGLISDTDTIGSAQIDGLDAYMSAVDNARSQLGANVNRLQHTANNLVNVIENTKAASGRIMDADFADESARMTKEQLLVQAGTKVLGHANQNTGLVMGLLG